jgi:hypothetical protein
MDGGRVRRVAAAAIAATALLHVYVGLIELEEYFGEVRYLGALFLIGSAAGFAVSSRLWHAADPAAWVIGAVVAAGMAGGFILSRTVGLPSFDERGEWEAEGLLSLALEGLYLAAFGAWAARARLVPSRAVGSASGQVA